MNYLTKVTGAVSGAFSGLTDDFQPNLKPSMDPWKSPFFTGTSMDGQAPGPKPPGAALFVAGDDIADQTALAKGVDPHRGVGWLKLAKTQIGSPYVWADSNPQGSEGGAGTGFDCSGYVQWLVKRVTGRLYTHHAATMATETQKVTKDQLVPGDLLFYNYGNGIQHVEVYIGGGKSIGSASGGVLVRNVDWADFQQGGRVPGMSSAGPIDMKAAVKRGRGRKVPAIDAAAVLPDNAAVPSALGSNYFSSSIMPIFTGGA